MVRYIHGTSQTEQERLSLLNRITNDSFIRYLGDLSDRTICDFGCGMGGLIADIASRHADVHITGLEVSEDQLRAAREATRTYPNVRLIHTDVIESDLAENTFDLVYCRYLLEHVADPVATAREMLRVVRPGGTVFCQENDLAYVVYYPDIEGNDSVMRALCDLQIAHGGDPFIGRKLFPIFKEAGAADISLSFEPETYTEDEPEGYRAWLGNARGIIAGVRDELVERGMIGAGTIDGVLSEMARRIDEPAGVALFNWNRAAAQKGA